MNLIAVKVSAPVTRPNQSADHGGLNFFRAMLMASMLLGGALAARPADAEQLTVVTSGTIDSGSETGNLFGLGSSANLAGDSYTLSVRFDGLGPNYYTASPGLFAEDFESSPGITGIVTATINGQSLTTTLSNSLGSSLYEDLYDLDASNNGSDSSGAFVSVSQDLSCTTGQCVPNADLLTPFNYILSAFDSGTDSYTFQGAGFPAATSPTASFLGTESSLDFDVPEPASWVVLAAGMLALGMLARRRRRV